MNTRFPSVVMSLTMPAAYASTLTSCLTWSVSYSADSTRLERHRMVDISLGTSEKPVADVEKVSRTVEVTTGSGWAWSRGCGISAGFEIVLSTITPVWPPPSPFLAMSGFRIPYSCLPRPLPFHPMFSIIFLIFEFYYELLISRYLIASSALKSRSTSGFPPSWSPVFDDWLFSWSRCFYLNYSFVLVCFSILFFLMSSCS